MISATNYARSGKLDGGSTSNERVPKGEGKWLRAKRNKNVCSLWHTLSSFAFSLSLIMLHSALTQSYPLTVERRERASIKTADGAERESRGLNELADRSERLERLSVSFVHVSFSPARFYCRCWQQQQRHEITSLLLWGISVSGAETKAAFCTRASRLVPSLFWSRAP